MTATTAVLLPLGLYLLVLLALGVWGRRGSEGVGGYYVAGKKLPSWVIAFSANATGESGWLLLGLTGMGYLVGFHALWVVLGEVMGVALAWVVVAGPFKSATDRFGSITVPDYLESRLGDTSQILRKVGVLIILVMTATYTSAQLVAAGKAFSSFLGISYGTGVLIGAAVTFFYTSVGGFKAVAYSDFVQGLLMALGLAVLPFVGFAAAGGWSAVIADVGAQDPGLLRPMGSYGISVAGVVSAASMATIGLAFLGVPQLLVRFISADSEREIRTGGFIATLVIVVFDVGAVLTGVAGRALFPGLADNETVMPRMADELFPALVTGIFLVVVLGAIMSTVDSLLILASSAVVRDLVQQVMRPDLPERRLAFWGRLTTFGIGLAALPFALREAQALFWFVLFAWSGLAAAFGPPVLLSLYSSRITRNGALAGMVGGFLVTVAWVLWGKARFHNLYELIPGLIVGLAVTWLASRPAGARPAETGVASSQGS